MNLIPYLFPPSTSRFAHLLYSISYILFFAVSLHAQDSNSKSRVAYLENPSLLNNYNPDPEGVKNALASLLTTLTGKSTPTDAWKSIGIGPDDIVAIKINARGDGRTSTRRALSDAGREPTGGAHGPHHAVGCGDAGEQLGDRRRGVRVHLAHGDGRRCRGASGRAGGEASVRWVWDM